MQIETSSQGTNGISFWLTCVIKTLCINCAHRQRILPTNKISSPISTPQPAPSKNMQSTSPIPIPLLKRAKSHTIVPGNKLNAKSRISHPQRKFQSIAITVHPISQHTDTLRNNKSVAAGSKNHKISGITLEIFETYITVADLEAAVKKDAEAKGHGKRLESCSRLL